MMRILLLPVALLLAGFSFVPPHHDLAAGAPVFVPEDFFIGRTVGKGEIRGAFSGRTAVDEQGVGRVDGDGTLVLDQHVQRAGHPPEQRQWRIRKTGAGRYAGTLTDARGPVTAEVNGNCLHLRYTIAKGNLAADQYLYLQAGGRVAINRMTVRRFGLTFATVEETIRRVG
ncbi:MAG: DUF3833 family protein [Sphingomonadales bacterium]